MSLSGNLEDVSVADALQFIHLGGRTLPGLPLEFRDVGEADNWTVRQIDRGISMRKLLRTVNQKATIETGWMNFVSDRLESEQNDERSEIVAGHQCVEF